MQGKSSNNMNLIIKVFLTEEHNNLIQFITDKRNRTNLQ